MSVDSRLLITGASGFIGTNMIEAAHRRGVTVAGLDIVAPRNSAHRDLVSAVDLLDAEATKAFVQSFAPTHVVHLAARTDLGETRDLSGYAANMEGTQNLLDALAGSGIARLIVASSMLVCENGYRPRDEFDLCPTTLYGESKVRTEEIVRASSGLPWVIVRPTSIWGPWFGTPYRDFFMTLARGRYVKPGRTRTVKAMGYVGNIVQQIEALLDTPAAGVIGSTFYVSDYEPYALDEWADEIADAMGRRRPFRVPLATLRAAGKLGDALGKAGIAFPLTSFRLNNMLTSSSFAMDRLAAIAGPQRTDRRGGVQETIAWLRFSGEL